MKKYPNTYTDISIQPAANIKKLIAEIGSERILFGTDYPFVSQAFSILSVLRATDIEQERVNIFSENAKKLLLGHFSSRYKSLDEMLNEAREVFSNTFLAKEGTKFEIPFEKTNIR